MDTYNFELFKANLERAVKKVYDDKASKIETYIKCEDKRYKIIIEEE